MSRSEGHVEPFQQAADLLVGQADLLLQLATQPLGTTEALAAGGVAELLRAALGPGAMGEGRTARVCCTIG